MQQPPRQYQPLFGLQHRWLPTHRAPFLRQYTLLGKPFVSDTLGRCVGEYLAWAINAHIHIWEVPSAKEARPTPGSIGSESPHLWTPTRTNLSQLWLEVRGDRVAWLQCNVLMSSKTKSRAWLAAG